MCNHSGKREEAIEAWLAVVMRLEPRTWHSLLCIATVYYSCTTSVISGFGIERVDLARTSVSTTAWMYE